ncbi:hypothetical protein ARMGADRAFT_1087611 [Armillaria gallica]|uniref:Uncharacterized protein n=1 Tax=Armillaria gallica TaxID=47427 RepID=A0A2H3CVG7_ARMGA|nr:hypothetical protein ARMGADRAFT_1087611 [Armillaria gallica]
MSYFGNVGTRSIDPVLTRQGLRCKQNEHDLGIPSSVQHRILTTPFPLTQVAKDHAENAKRKSNDTIDLSSSGSPIDGQELAKMQCIDDIAHCPVLVSTSLKIPVGIRMELAKLKTLSGLVSNHSASVILCSTSSISSILNKNQLLGKWASCIALCPSVSITGSRLRKEYINEQDENVTERTWARAKYVLRAYQAGHLERGDDAALNRHKNMSKRLYEPIERPSEQEQSVNRRTYIGKLVNKYLLSFYRTSKVSRIPSVHLELLSVPPDARSPDVDVPSP